MAKSKVTQNDELENIEYIDLEDALIELEKISQQLEEPNIKLNEAIKLYQRGKELAKICYKQLKEAEIKIKEIKADLSEYEFRKEDL
ncbi:MAG TPA: exodeoxyribonuclease VII small subunit [Ignavibacteriales bacterium]|nr:exodeoxyribonuclease VII small subunit [Ignavibacteriales bacterium]HOL81808.1 exodeoxyribonuclease VII small subunit [Ignavibacteriales bacterium]HOM65817.1 exodeoxyribonuclease VII small subunit [Ignavibacteriales bacterium]HPD67080.1 exodeoxyribonuclease VII small subunit [Ignavibacteriales bacterium]HPP33945.1 exodeoxyribonuclease VII small subunit [Ignavibacteriales bacterium]